MRSKIHFITGRTGWKEKKRMAQSFYVSLSPHDAEARIHAAVVGGSVTGEEIDRFMLDGPDGKVCLVSIYEKHFWRAGNRLTLTATVDNLQGRTRVHLVSGGGGEGLFRFDWGASESFESCAIDALAPFRL